MTEDVVVASFWFGVLIPLVKIDMRVKTIPFSSIFHINTEIIGQVTPTSFLELLTSFVSILADKRHQADVPSAVHGDARVTM